MDLWICGAVCAALLAVDFLRNGDRSLVRIAIGGLTPAAAKQVTSDSVVPKPPEITTTDDRLIDELGIRSELDGDAARERVLRRIGELKAIILRAESRWAAKNRSNTNP